MIYSEKNSIPLVRQTVEHDRKYSSISIEEIKKSSSALTVYGLAIVTRKKAQIVCDGQSYIMDYGIDRVSHKRLFDKPIRSAKKLAFEKQEYLERYKAVPA